MGLHSKVRYEIVFKSENRITQKDEIEKFATGLYDFIFDFIDQSSCPRMEITQKLARFISRAFTFVGYEDDEIYSILLKIADLNRKQKVKS